MRYTKKRKAAKNGLPVFIELMKVVSWMKLSLNQMMKDMTKIEIRQELYCDFTASASEVVIPIDLVTEAAHRTLVSEMLLVCQLF